MRTQVLQFDQSWNLGALIKAPGMSGWVTMCRMSHTNLVGTSFEFNDMKNNPKKKACVIDGRSPTAAKIHHSSLGRHLPQRCPCVGVIKMTSHCNVLRQFPRISLRFPLSVIRMHRTTALVQRFLETAPDDSPASAKTQHKQKESRENCHKAPSTPTHVRPGLKGQFPQL